VKGGDYMTQLDAKVLAYLNKPQKKHIDDISYNTNIQLEVLQETLNNLVHLSYVEQDHELDNTPMPPNVVSIFFIPTGFYSITPKGMHALAEYNITQKETRKKAIISIVKWLIPLIFTVVGWFCFTK
jgi:hypothetical protein